GEGRLLDRRVTVAAVDADPSDVVLVAERDGLLARDALLRVVGGALDRRGDEEKADDEEEGAEDADLREGVGARMKDLRHPCPNASSAEDDSKKAADHTPIAVDPNSARRRLVWPLLR